MVPRLMETTTHISQHVTRGSGLRLVGELSSSMLPDSVRLDKQQYRRTWHRYGAKKRPQSTVHRSVCVCVWSLENYPNNISWWLQHVAAQFYERIVEPKHASPQFHSDECARIYRLRSCDCYCSIFCMLFGKLVGEVQPLNIGANWDSQQVGMPHPRK